jgi:hypothetical protein
MVNEGSGSIRHEIEHIHKNGDIIINRLLPDKDIVMTADMAEWHIIIELSNDFKPEQLNIILHDKIIS